MLFNTKKRYSQLAPIKEIVEGDSPSIEEGKIIKKYFKEYLATSPDDMEYDDVIKKDTRNFCNYFFDNLKQKQNIAYTFIATDRINT